MKKYYIGIFFLVLAGSILGFYPEKYFGPSITQTEKPTVQKGDLRDSLLQRTSNMEFNIAEIEKRLSGLENALETKKEIEAQDKISRKQLNDDNNVTETNGLPMIDVLIKAGIDTFSAEEIVRKQNKSALRRLELRDNAIREGYIGTNKFREEIKKIRAEEISIRDEIDAASYDKYLFYTGRPNRIRVASVIQGSVAEAGGIQEGDRVLRYENRPIYNTGDLRSSTIEGTRGEIINLTIQRRNTLITMSVPRGPLGIRLESISVNPTKSQ